MPCKKIACLGGNRVTDPTPNLEEQKTLLMDAFLDALYENTKPHSHLLVTAGLKRLRNDAWDTSASYESSEQLQDRSQGKSRIIAWGVAVAALMLIAVTVRILDTSQTAVAAVDASIAQSLQEIGRRYSVTTKLRLSETNTVDCNVDLFVKGASRFALRGESLLSARPLWIGNDQGAAWVVPPRGPVLEGNTENLMQWVIGQEDIGTPYLHLSTILTRMRDFYALKSLPDQSVKIGTQHLRCRHILGKLDREDSVHRPDVIELWSDAESGFTVQLIARWHLPKGQVGRELLQIQFQENVELHDHFFTPDAHGGKDRSRIDFSD